jgi:hypothetical protein
MAPIIIECAEEGCSETVTYDPGDRRHRAHGALLERGLTAGSAIRRPTIVYLECSKGHIRRYEISNR